MDLKANPMKTSLVLLSALLATTAFAKLPVAAPTDKAKAAEAAAKTAHGNKVEAFKLCKSMDKSAAHYFKASAAAKKEVKPAVAMPPCADPGPYVAAVAVPAVPVAAAPAPVAAAAAPKKP